MEQASNQRSVKKVWTFKITGSSPFEVKIPKTPMLSHSEHSVTLWKMVGTEKAANAVKTFIVTCIPEAKVEVFSEGETNEQKQIRLDRLLLGE